MENGVGALIPFDSLFNYNDRMYDISGVMTTWLDGPGGLVKMYARRNN